MGIGVSGLPSLRKEFFSKHGVTFNLMVVGSKGLGKTTLINNLIKKPILNIQPFSENTHDKFWYDSQVCNIQISNVELLENEFSLKLNIVEVDGIGDHTNNTDCERYAVQELKNRFIEYQNKLGHAVKLLVDDKRIHLCLYVIEPLETIKTADVQAMKAIAQHCNLIPVITKMDILSAEQIHNIRIMFKNLSDVHDIQFYNYSHSDVIFPWFVALGNTKDGEISYIRKYPWGDLNILELPENDLMRIRECIFEHSMLKMIKSTQKFYENFMVSQLAEKFAENHNNHKQAELLNKIDQYNREIESAKNGLEQKKSEIDNASRNN